MAYLALWPLLLLSRALCLLAPRRVGALGSGLGWLLRAARFRRGIVRSNLELALGQETSPREKAALEKAIYRNVGTLFLEIARNFAMDRSQRLRELRISEENLGKMRDALARGPGAVFITAHIANWELFASGMAAHIPVSVVAKRMNSSISQALVERQRKLGDLEIIYSGGALRSMREHLGRGRAIGFMVDQNTTGEKGIRANFFGVPASSIRGLAGLARETGVPIVPICAYRLPCGNHEVCLLDPLPYLEADHLPEGSAERAAREEWLNTQQYQSAIESLVRRRPEQWLWIHRRWKANRTPIDTDRAHLAP